jgi:aspartyl-tRNA(Asn)/glutamyl-tRNA(Gln) amidotransferase subunit B
MEIVGEPDLRSPDEARQYLIQLRNILRYLEVSTGNMEEGSFRCDANISIRPENSKETLAKVEVKNMNSFRAVYLALEYEAKRQKKAAAEGKRLVQETRGWVEEKGKTVSQRSKEYAHDYRYFPEPDLPPLMVTQEWVKELSDRLPELPDTRRDRFVEEYGLPLYDASLLTASKAMANYEDDFVAVGKPASMPKSEIARLGSNWILGEVSRILNAENIDITAFRERVSPEQLSALVSESQAAINIATAKSVLDEMYRTGRGAAEIIEERGLSQISDAGEIQQAVSQVIVQNPKAVADFKAGKNQSLTFLVGQVMRATRGRANPKLVNEEIKKRLEE